MSKNVKELFDLTGRLAIVTGGCGAGFGRQIVEALAEAGATVVATSRSEDKAAGAEAMYAKRELNIKGVVLDLLNEASVDAAVSEVVDKYGSPDILVNNASGNHFESFETVKLEDWRRVLDVNITGAMLMARQVAPSMMYEGKGTIINVSSIYGVVAPDQRIYGDTGINSPLVYGVSKAALLQMSRYLATYYAPKIRVNSITPGGLFNDQDNEFLKGYYHKTPLGRMAGPDDLKGAALFLASDAAAWITGENLVVDGGWTTW